MHALSHPGPDKLRVIGLRLVVLAVASSLLLIVRATPPAQHIDIPGVPPQALARAGITFLPPNGTPAVSEEKARLVAVGGTPFDFPILETVLVRMIDQNAGPPIGQLVWVNRIDITGHRLFVSSGNYIPPNLQPTGNYIPEGSQSEPQAATPEPRPPQTYYLIFVDANTGEVLYAVYG